MRQGRRTFRFSRRRIATASTPTCEDRTGGSAEGQSSMEPEDAEPSGRRLPDSRDKQACDHRMLRRKSRATVHTNKRGDRSPPVRLSSVARLKRPRRPVFRRLQQIAHRWHLQIRYPYGVRLSSRLLAFYATSKPGHPHRSGLCTGQTASVEVGGIEPPSVTRPVRRDYDHALMMGPDASGFKPRPSSPPAGAPAAQSVMSSLTGSGSRSASTLSTRFLSMSSTSKRQPNASKLSPVFGMRASEVITKPPNVW